MKLQLGLRVRQGLIALLSVLVLASAITAVIKFTQPATVVEKTQVYEYQQKVKVDYQVFVLPNPFFEEESIGAGQGYLTPITDHIMAYLSYQLQGNGPAKIDGHYQVTAAVTGYLLKENNTGGQRIKVRVWERTYPLVPETPLASSDGKVDLSKDVRINIREYVNFAERVQDEYKSAIDLAELSVRYDIQTGIETPEGRTTDSVCPAMIIPIKGNSFTVDGTLADTKEGAIVVDKTVPVPLLKESRIGFSAAAVVFAIALLWVLFRTSVRAEDPLENELKRIIKKYGDRIVTGSGPIPNINKNSMILVSDFEDLIRVADEVAQPILHESIIENVHNFYVMNGPVLYAYTLEPAYFEQPLDMDAQPHFEA
ncbi:MAG: DUF5305 domain-containing protein [Bacillota bacterium]